MADRKPKQTERELSFVVGESELARRIRAYPWAETELGPLATWPDALKTLVSVMLASNQQMYVVWGPSRTLLYNDRYIEVLQGHHPNSLGRNFLEVWDEIADDLTPLVENAFAGVPTYMDDIVLVLERKGYAEETHFAYSYTPVFNADGRVNGFFCACIETTEQVKAEEALRRSEEKYRTLFEGIAEGYLVADVIFDPVGQPVDIEYVASNAAAIRMVGTDLTGKRLRSVSADYEEYWYEIWGRVAVTGQSERAQRYASPEGLWYDFHVFKLEPDNRESPRVAVLFQDVTERKRAEAELRESEERQVYFLALSDALRSLADRRIFEFHGRVLERHTCRDRKFPPDRVRQVRL